MSSIYVLQLDNPQLEKGKKYIGRTDRDVQIRFQEHLSTKGGSAWTRKYRPLYIIEIRPSVSMFDEDNVTKEYMLRYGIDNVRGGSYVQINLDETTYCDLRKQIWMAQGKCIRCGRDGHFATKCKLKTFVDGGYIGGCSRCGRSGHTRTKCHLKSHINGTMLETSVPHVSTPEVPTPSGSTPGTLTPSVSTPSGATIGSPIPSGVITYVIPKAPVYTQNAPLDHVPITPDYTLPFMEVTFPSVEETSTHTEDIQDIRQKHPNSTLTPTEYMEVFNNTRYIPVPLDPNVTDEVNPFVHESSSSDEELRMDIPTTTDMFGEIITTLIRKVIMGCIECDEYISD
jgi:predicted GIY-YIG superfamily endonuclease